MSFPEYGWIDFGYLQKLGFLEQRRDVVLGMQSIVCYLTPDRTKNPISHASGARNPLV